MSTYDALETSIQKHTDAIDALVSTTSTARDTAVSKASTATTKASEAFDSAESAELHKLAAEAAKNGAETAESNAVAITTDYDGSTTPAAGKHPVAGGDGTFPLGWVDNTLLHMMLQGIGHATDLAGREILDSRDVKQLVHMVLHAADIANQAARKRTPEVPATASSQGDKGDIAFDSSYIYVCVDTDTWMRAGIGTWT